MRLHLVDGTYELFRSHFSKVPPRTDPDGMDVKATIGVVSTLLRLLDDPDEAPTHLGVAFDNPIESFRNEEFPGYKDSSDVDPALLAQFDRVEEAVRSLGIHVWSMDRYEADDALGAAALRFVDEVDQVRILTPDKDLGQVVRGTDIVQVDRRRGQVLDAAGVQAKLGVPPASVPDFLGLVGDAADGIPGLPGFGAKTAAALLTRYGHIEHIPADPAAWDVTVRGAPRLAATLRDRADDAKHYRHLATLVTDLDLGVELDAMAWRGVPREPYLQWCEQVGTTSLVDRPSRWAS